MNLFFYKSLFFIQQVKNIVFNLLVKIFGLNLFFFFDYFIELTDHLVLSFDKCRHTFYLMRSVKWKQGTICTNHFSILYTINLFNLFMLSTFQFILNFHLIWYHILLWKLNFFKRLFWINFLNHIFILIDWKKLIIWLWVFRLIKYCN